MTNRNNTLELEIPSRVVLRAPRPNDRHNTLQFEAVYYSTIQSGVASKLSILVPPASHWKGCICTSKVDCIEAQRSCWDCHTVLPLICGV